MPVGCIIKVSNIECYGWNEVRYWNACPNLRYTLGFIILKYHRDIIPIGFLHSILSA